MLKLKRRMANVKNVGVPGGLAHVVNDSFEERESPNGCNNNISGRQEEQTDVKISPTGKLAWLIPLQNAHPLMQSSVVNGYHHAARMRHS
eukprot:390441-Amphidinium_carterae.1